MNRAAFLALVAVAVAVGLWFRLAELDLRPMHHDEANQAVRFGHLLETGEYRYDRHDHHGPTLYYLTFPAAWMRGQTTLASLDERTLRLVPAAFGVGLILLLPLLSAGLGRPAVAAGALLAALSPALTYYSRFYIQESLFTFFALGFLVALGRYRTAPGAAAAAWAGAFAGLAYATKETSLIVLATATAAAMIASRWAGPTARARPSLAGPAAASGWTAGVPARVRVAHLATALAAALVVAAFAYTSFFGNPSGLLESVRAFGIYLDRGVDPAAHAAPWHYYLGLLAWSSSGGLVWTEALVLVLALAGIAVACFRRRDGFWPRYVLLYTVMTAAVFSVVRYKTPWNLLPFYAGIILLAGVGAAALITFVRSRALRALVVTGLLAASVQLGLQSARASFPYAADPRNPYAYAHTSPDFLRLVTRVADLAALHPDGAGMLVKVVAGPYEQWPLPWYLRRMPHVGYWTNAADAGSIDDVPVIVSSMEQAEAVEARVGDDYVSEFYGLRPHVLLKVFIERTLWERFLETRRSLTAATKRDRALRLRRSPEQ